MPFPFTPPIGRAQNSARRSRLNIEVLEDRVVLSSGLTAPVLTAQSFDPEHILVQYREGATPVALPGTQIGKLVDEAANLYQIDLQDGTTVGGALAAYQADERVSLAEADALLSTTAVPNDPKFSSQWSLQNKGQSGGKVGADIKATSAWNVTKGSMRTTVSVMDTGVDYTHPDLYQNIWINQREIPSSRKANLRDYDGDGLITFRDLNDSRNKGLGKITDLNGNGRIDGGDLLKPMVKDAYGRDTGKGGWANKVSEDGDRYVDDLIGWNFSANTNNPMDDYGHGTHVAGTIGATGNNAVGVAGVNWAVQIMPLKFMSSTGAGSISGFIAALNYAVAKGAKISNNSWEGASYSSMLVEAINNARSSGHIFVAAAGNQSRNNDATPIYPASFRIDNVVSVAATDRYDRLASFSNYGATSVHLAAPGKEILSTTRGGSYSTNSGTSMATPHVAGVMALVWSAHPTWTYKQVITQVLNTADRLSTLTGKVKTGARLNAAAALGATVQTTSTTTTTTQPRIVSAGQAGPSANTLNRIRVTFDRSMLPSTFGTADVYLTGPSGQRIWAQSVKVVAGTSNRTYDINFATQYAAGSYSLRVGPEVFDAAYRKMSIYYGTFRLAAATTSSTTTRTYTSNTDVAIVPYGRAVSLLTINDSYTIADVQVKVNIRHPYMGDLYIHLQGPDGTNIVLANRKGGPSDNMVNTVFSDAGSKPIGYGVGPFTGTWKPDVPLSYLDGKNVKGTWKMWVEDRGGVNRGTLDNWSLIIKPK